MKDADRSIGLDLTRAVAVVLVLLAHFIHKIESLGFWGVELFFALSGFLIGGILWRSYSRSVQWTGELIMNFWKRRWFRTLPNYYLFILVELVIRGLLDQPLPSPEKFIGFIFFVQDFSFRDGEFFGISWSLCIEEWFYLTFPLVVYFFDFFSKNKKHVFFLAIILYVLASIFVRHYLLLIEPGQPVRGITIARLDAIVYGVAVALVYYEYFSKSSWKKAWRNASAFVGLLLLAIAFDHVYLSNLKYSDAKASNMLLTLAPAGFALTLPWINECFKFAGMLFVKRVIRNISLWSYSIYLSHIPILLVTYEVLSPIRDSLAGNILSKVLGILLTIFISKIVYEKFEKKLTDMRPREI